jgi:hypothetical protein
MKNKLLTPDTWNDYYIPIDFQLLNEVVINNSLQTFLNEIINNIGNKHIILLFRIQFIDGTPRTIGNLQKVNKEDFNKLYSLLNNLLEILSNEYKEIPLMNIIFSYKIIPEDKLVNKQSKIDDNNIKKDKLPTFKFYGYNLPTNIDYKLWGTILYKKDSLLKIRKHFSSLIYNINFNLGYNIIEILDSNNNIILKFIDKYSEDKSSFIRIINNQTYHIKNGQLILKSLKKTTNYLKSLKIDKKLNNKFITLDIETQTINNVMTPYCICFYDGKYSKSFYLSDYKNNQEMLLYSITSLLKRKYNGYKVYVHNLSNFDGIFLVKILSSIDNIKLYPVIKDDKMIDIKLTYSNFSKYNISFRDSLLMLPSSLRNLSKQFMVDNKGIFPYNFINNQYNNKINLNYIGKVPEYKYFRDLNLDQYNVYIKFFKNKKWSLKDETIKYCNQDCISLYQIIEKFNTLIFNKYSINIHKYPTLPSLAFGIYRTHYLKDYPIPLLSGLIFNDLSKSFTGGSTDMYIPSGENIYAYDVNSLYPYVMNNFDMPIGNITFFEGNILKINSKAFGFFECIITAPKDLKHPILQSKIDTGNGIRTISPLGTWTGTYFSEEIYNAMKFGYKIEILRGYTFDKANIFKEYINDLYEIKKASNKDEPMYLISKLLMNSLYGRFGMNELLNNNIIIDDNDIYNYIDKYTINNIISLDNNKSIISYFDNNIKNTIMLSNETHSNISIGIASAITAYARIHMTQFKNNNNYNLYYTDTDSIYIDKILSNNYISNDLGKMKLEYNFNEATFLGPKVYGGLFFDNNNQLKAITKVKGYKNKIDYYDLKSLLNKDNFLKLDQTKWFKNISESNITLKNQEYTLIPTKNKRELIYDNNNILVNTKPFIINNNNIVKD